MFTKSDIETKLDAEILSLLNKLKETTKESDEYTDLIERISRLHKLKTEEQTTLHKLDMENRPKRISPDNALAVAANIFGILWLTRYERENVISSKALGFAMKVPGNR